MNRKLHPLILSLLAVSACAVGPDYQKPADPAPEAFKETGKWDVAQPMDAIDRGAWWSVYRDPLLNQLEQQLEISNQTIKQAEANYRAALAAADLTRAGLFPTVAIGPSVTRSGSGGGAGRSTGVGSSTTTTVSTTTAYSGGRSAATSYDLSASGSWAVDLWGRIRREVESEQETAQADAADIANARLSVQALLATYYFELRIQDKLADLLKQTVIDDQKVLTIVENQYKVGIAAQSDVLTARTQLESVSANSINVAIARAQYEHAIAVLVGRSPSDFALAATNDKEYVPVIPPSVPSQLLERRPDIAASERAMAAANAEIGVAEAAYYPDLTLSASYGFGATALSGLVSAANSIWSFGASASETLIDFGARDAASEEARATYDAALAGYRQTVLVAFQNVEDNLAAQRILTDQEKSQAIATGDARKSEQIALNQYKEGIIPYNNVLTTQITRLGDEQTLLTVHGDRLAASVALIEALGGGWDSSQLPAMGPTGFLPIPSPISLP